MSAEEIKDTFNSATENARLKARIRELEARLAVSDEDVEINHGEVFFIRGNDRRRNPPELPGSKISTKASANIG